MRKTALFLLFCAAAGAQQASFEGVAVNQVAGEPLSGVHVMLYTLSAEGTGDVYGAISNRDGRFSLASVKPGTYFLQPVLIGFVHMVRATGAVSAARITLKGGEHIADYRLEMTPRAAIYGRVVNEYGDPTPNLLVEASPMPSVPDYPEPTPISVAASDP